MRKCQIVKKKFFKVLLPLTHIEHTKVHSLMVTELMKYTECAGSKYIVTRWLELCRLNLRVGFSQNTWLNSEQFKVRSFLQMLHSIWIVR